VKASSDRVVVCFETSVFVTVLPGIDDVVVITDDIAVISAGQLLLVVHSYVDTSSSDVGHTQTVV